MVKKLVESIMPSTMFDGDGIPDWGGLLLSADSAIARKYNPRPETTDIFNWKQSCEEARARVRGE